MVYNEKEKIDSKFDDVAEILPGKENVHIKARVIRLWKLPAFINLCESNLLELVLIDEKVRVLRLWKVPAFLNPPDSSSLEMVLVDEKLTEFVKELTVLGSWRNMSSSAPSLAILMSLCIVMTLSLVMSLWGLKVSVQLTMIAILKI
ncbi:replication protein A 70 kDa DNA-binding subunit C [Trifolium repens]|nr:replication protein A 70 kDa DNA-binding subunit C [Trifolium repens]